MEELENREQPLGEPANALNLASDNSAVSENGSLNNMAEVNQDEADLTPEPGEQENQDLGKFKSAKALLEAYNNLQSEFTKKCQRLSELEKDKTDENVPQVQEIDIDESLNQFLLKNTEAKDYADELKAKVLASGEKISAVTFDNAWANLVLSHIKDNACKAEDKLVDKYVLSDENVKNKIIQDYVNSLKQLSTPIVISSNKGQRVSDVVSDTPHSLNDAKVMMERLFN